MPAVPGWLLGDERYEAREDRDAFLDRSILAFLGLLARGRALGGGATGRVRTEPLAKVVSTVILLLLVSLSRSPVFVAMAGSGLLALLSLQEGRLIARVLKAAGAAALFTFVIMLPSAFWGRGPAAAMITAKVFLSVTCVQLVAATTEQASLTGVFKRLGVPDLFILVFDIALKYIFLLGEFALTMVYALRLRSVGRNSDQTGSLAGVAGTLFVKSTEMAEEMVDAMACRGFTGQFRTTSRLRLGRRDAALGAAVGLLIAAFCLTRRG